MHTCGPRSPERRWIMCLSHPCVSLTFMCLSHTNVSFSHPCVSLPSMCLSPIHISLSLYLSLHSLPPSTLSRNPWENILRWLKKNTCFPLDWYAPVSAPAHTTAFRASLNHPQSQKDCKMSENFKVLLDNEQWSSKGQVELVNCPQSSLSDGVVLVKAG